MAKLFVPYSGRSAIFRHSITRYIFGGQKLGGVELNNKEDGSLDAGMPYLYKYLPLQYHTLFEEDLTAIIDL